MLFAIPVGVMSGIYIHEYNRDGRFKRFIKLMTNNLAGIPSIVFWFVWNGAVCELYEIRGLHYCRFSYPGIDGVAGYYSNHGRVFESD